MVPLNANMQIHFFVQMGTAWSINFLTAEVYGRRFSLLKFNCMEMVTSVLTKGKLYLYSRNKKSQLLIFVEFLEEST
jgi:hypothetical protein